MKMIGHDHFIFHSYCHFSVLSHILLSDRTRRSGRTSNEKVLCLMHKIKGGETFHLIAVQSPVRGIVNLLNISLVAECRIFGEPCNGSLGAIAVSYTHLVHDRVLR